MTPTATPPPAALSPIGKGEKTAFTFGSIGKNMLFWGIGTFLLIFYTDVFGLSPAAVGTLFLVARLLDAVNDPIVGYILDHLKPTRWGRFRPWLLMGGILAGLNFAALFLGPELSYTGKLLYAYITYLVFGLTFDLVDIPYSSLMVTMTQNTHERNKLNSLVAIGLIVGTGLAVVGTVPLVNMFATPQQGYRMVGLIYGLIALVCVAISAIGAKERVQANPDQSYTLRQLYPILIKNKPFMILMLSTVLFSIGNFVVTGTNVIFYTYFVGSADLFGPVQLATGPAILAAAIAMPYLARRFGKRNTYMLGFSLTIGIGVLFFLVQPTSLLVLILFAAGMAVAGSPGAALIDSMVADTNEYAEWQTGARSEGAIQAGFTFVKKSANGIGGAVAGYMLALIGYQPNMTQSPETLTGLIAMVSLVPAFFAALAMAAMYFYPLTEGKFNAILVDLQARKTAV
jgi:glycoside/pentoside/hexuronide:cation symporter, GPH family